MDALAGTLAKYIEDKLFRLVKTTSTRREFNERVSKLTQTPKDIGIPKETRIEYERYVLDILVTLQCDDTRAVVQFDAFIKNFMSLVMDLTSEQFRLLDTTGRLPMLFEHLPLFLKYHSIDYMTVLRRWTNTK